MNASKLFKEKITVAWIALALLVSGQNAMCNAKLALYQPNGWSDKIVVTKTKGSKIDSAINAGDTLYISWAISNDGTTDIDHEFDIGLYIDGNNVRTWTKDSLKSGWYWEKTDVEVAALGAGKHRIRIIADLDGTSASYEREIEVAGPSSGGNEFAGKVGATVVGGVSAWIIEQIIEWWWVGL